MEAISPCTLELKAEQFRASGASKTTETKGVVGTAEIPDSPAEAAHIGRCIGSMTEV